MFPEAARKLMKAFWPGPLTLLLPRTRPCRTGERRGGLWWGADAGASGGAGVDSAGPGFRWPRPARIFLGTRVDDGCTCTRGPGWTH